CCFFFSSRRRHTSFSRDWSSDVCSSDLELDAWVRAGQWSRPVDETRFGCDVHGKTLGIIGLGKIGAAIARRGRFGFGMDIVYNGNSRKPELERELGARFLSREAL